VVSRRSLALFVVTVVMMAVSPGWAKAGRSENSCGASNAEFGKAPSKERTLGNCGVENRGLFSDKPEGLILVRRPRRNRVLENDVSHQAGRGLPVVCWSGICRLGSIQIGSLGPINTLPFDHNAGQYSITTLPPKQEDSRYAAVRQYSLPQILPVWAAAAIPMAVRIERSRRIS
jgi:hypothetical protein